MPHTLTYLSIKIGNRSTICTFTYSLAPSLQHHTYNIACISTRRAAERFYVGCNALRLLVSLPPRTCKQTLLNSLFINAIEFSCSHIWMYAYKYSRLPQQQAHATNTRLSARKENGSQFMCQCALVSCRFDDVVVLLSCFARWYCYEAYLLLVVLFMYAYDIRYYCSIMTRQLSH